MAVRINASGESLKRTANLPSPQAFTICGWAKLTKRASQFQYFAGLETPTSSSTDWVLIGFNDSGGFEISQKGETGSLSSAPSDETWFFFAIASDSSSLIGRWCVKADTSFGAGHTASVGDVTFTPAHLMLGNDSWDEYCNVALAYVKVYDVKLTDAQLLAEKDSATPVKTSDLRAYWPLEAHTDLADYSGNGYSLTGSGTLSTEDGPPNLTYAKAASDSASLSDSSSLDTGGESKSGTDSATLSESAALEASVPAADSATLSESSAAAVTTTYLVEDGAALYEDATDIASDGAMTDLITLSESASVSVSLSVADAATMMEAVGTDVALAATDAAAMSEAVGVSAALAAADIATAGEAIALSAAVPASDAGALGEASDLDQGATPAAATDEGALAESASVDAALGATDAGEVSDAAGLVAHLSAVDSATLGESSDANGNASHDVADAGAVSETAAISAAGGVSDAFTLGESASVTVVLSAVDAVTVTDAAVVAEPAPTAWRQFAAPARTTTFSTSARTTAFATKE